MTDPTGFVGEGTAPCVQRSSCGGTTEGGGETLCTKGGKPVDCHDIGVARGSDAKPNPGADNSGTPKPLAAPVHEKTGLEACGQCNRYHPGAEPYVAPPQEGVEAICPECYAIGTGGIAKGIFRAFAAKLGLVEAEAVSKSVWSLSPFERGVAIEKTLGQNLPQNFPVIDKFENGLATSIKSMDLSAKSYQSIATLDRTLKGYIDSVSTFNGRRWAGQEVSGVTSRALELAIPNAMSVAQHEALVRALQYGRSVGVDVKIIVIK